MSREGTSLRGFCEHSVYDFSRGTSSCVVVLSLQPIGISTKAPTQGVIARVEGGSPALAEVRQKNLYARYCLRSWLLLNRGAQQSR